MSLTQKASIKSHSTTFSLDTIHFSKEATEERRGDMRKPRQSEIDSMKAMGRKSTLLSDGEVQRGQNLAKSLMERLSIARIQEAQRGSKLRHLAGSMAVHMTRPELRSLAKSLTTQTQMTPGEHMRATASKTAHSEKGESQKVPEETTTKSEGKKKRAETAGTAQRAETAGVTQPESSPRPEGPYVPKHRGKPQPVLGVMKTKVLQTYKEKDQELRARLTPRDKAILTTLGAKKAAAHGAMNTLVSLCAMRGEDQDEGVTHTTRRNIVAIEKLRGHEYIEKKDKRMAEMTEDAIRALEAERAQKDEVDVIGLTARLANFGGTFGPEIYEYRPKFDPDRVKAEKKIAERFVGKDMRMDKEEIKVCEPIWDTWDVRMRGEMRAGMTAREQKQLDEMEKKMKELEKMKMTKEEEAQASSKDTTTPSDICPRRLCERAPCREPQPRPPVYQRTIPEFPQFNSCTLVGNWVEERRCYERKTHCPFSIYNFDYRKPCPPVPYSKHPYYANMVCHRGVPYDVLFTHGTLPPPRRWTQICQPPSCAPCCQPISCVTESRANYRPPPQGSYVVCRRATPKALSSSYETISRNIWNWHLRGEQLRMVPTPCG